jgi:putative ABC transport system permease protein
MAVTVGAMVVALAMLVSVSTMVHSFRRTVQVWIGQTIRADLYVSRAARMVRGADSRLPGAVLEAVRDTPGVAEVDGLRALHLEDDRGAFVLVAGNLDVLARRGSLLFRGGNPAAVLQQLTTGGRAAVSETFAERRGLREGDWIRLQTPGGPVSLQIAGVYYDYTPEGGVVLLDRALFRKAWGDDWLTSLAIYLAPGSPSPMRLSSSRWRWRRSASSTPSSHPCWSGVGRSACCGPWASAARASFG